LFACHHREIGCRVRHCLDNLGGRLDKTTINGNCLALHLARTLNPAPRLFDSATSYQTNMSFGMLQKLFPQWRGSLMHTSRASDIASGLRTKLQDLFLLGDYFQRMSYRLFVDSAVARHINGNITSFGYCLESSHQATRSFPSWRVLLEDVIEQAAISTCSTWPIYERLEAPLWACICLSFLYTLQVIEHCQRL
jgi:hypothetical protein